MSGEQLCLPAKDWHTAATENAVGLGKSRRIMRGFRCTLGISGHPFTIKILILCTLGGALFNSGCVGLVSGSNGGGSPTTLTISNAVTANATPTSVGIDWQTSAPANSQVEYGTTTSYGSTTPVDSTMVTTHQLTVSGLNPGTTYLCRVHSTDARNNSAVSGDLPCSTPKDTTPPTVSITSPAANATLSGTANLTASASDNVAVASVQFKVDSANTGAAVTAAPYTYALNTAALSNGNHTLTAVATDTSGNTASSAGVPVSVNNATHAPSIASLNPASGLVGMSVTITGANFGMTQGTSTVTFNGIAATPTSWAATSIVVPVAAGATTGNVVVTVGGVASNGVSFTVTVPPPSITGLNPTSGVLGTSVTITGANFGASQGTSTVTFNGIGATPTSWSVTNIVVPVPAGATTGNVVVTVGGVASNGVSFTVTTPGPSITGLNPTSGLVGASVTITGANFGATQGTSTVKFNGTAATPTSWSATSIVTPVPTGATTGNVVVTVGGVASNGVTFTVQTDTTAPTVTITAPANNSSVSGTITLTATATDPDSAVSFVQFQVNGANVGAKLTSTPYSISLDTTTLSNGGHTLTAVAQDPSANQGTSPPVSITVSNTTTSSSTITLVQQAELFVSSGARSISQSFSSVSTTGDLIVATVKWGGQNLSIASITDDKGDVYQSAAGPTNWSGTTKCAQTFYANNIAGGGVPITITVKLDGASTGNLHLYQFEYSGVDVASPLDTVGAATGTGTNISAGPLTTRYANDLIHAVTFTDTGTTMPGAGFQALATYSGNLVENETAGAAGTHGVTATNSGGANWFMHAIAFKAASTGGTPADTTPPVVTVTAPANGATVSGTITLTATATDPDSAVSFVQFQVDGANVGAQLTTAPYSLSLNTTTLSNATHALTAVAQDPSGNVGTSGAVTITVSNATAGMRCVRKC